MSIDDFGTPIYDQSETTDSSPSTPAPTANFNSNSSADLNDLTLSSESLETNEHLDAYAAPPPIDDGVYTVKVKRIDTKDNRPYTRKVIESGKYAGRETFFTQLELTIIDNTGKNDGRKLFDRYVTSAPNPAGAIPIVAVLKAFGVAVPANSNNAQLWQMFDKATKTEPTIRIETQWEANLPQEISDIYKEPKNRAAKIYAPRLQGQNKFPDDPRTPGKKLTDVKLDCSNIGKGEQHATAQARVSRYLPLK